VKTYRSRFSGRLEIGTDENGVKVLDTQHANYSYGPAQKVLSKALRYGAIGEVKHLLVFGLGGGSLLHLLKTEHTFGGKITVVEIDPVMIEVAEKEFDIRQSRKLKIVCDDALHFAQTTRRKFDGVFVDISIGFELPEFVTSESFFQSLQRCSSPKQQWWWNALKGGKQVNGMIRRMKANNHSVEVHRKVNGTNTIVHAARNDG
jgi:spermidine synthase